MPPVKPLDRIARKWIDRASVAGPEYEAGVSAPKVPWDTAAAAANAIYVAEVTRAAQAGNFERGVRAAGNAKWQNRARSLGPGRFGEGVRVAEPEYRARFGSIRQAIEAASLPGKGPKGSPAQVARFTAMRDVLIAAGRALRGGGAR
ncbi:MAG: hypothetical protein ACREN5_09845 [Gemmatimonadales bacterium]